MMRRRMMMEETSDVKSDLFALTVGSTQWVTVTDGNVVSFSISATQAVTGNLSVNTSRWTSNTYVDSSAETIFVAPGTPDGKTAKITVSAITEVRSLTVRFNGTASKSVSFGNISAGVSKTLDVPKAWEAMDVKTIVIAINNAGQFEIHGEIV